MTTSNLVVILLLVAAACSKKDTVQPGHSAPDAGNDKPLPHALGDERKSAMRLTSSAYTEQSTMKKRYTCQGDDVSPPLAWSGAPEQTKSFAFVLDDPDAPDPAAPKTVWVHWVLYDLPADTHSLSEGVHELPAGTREGKNDWKQTGYRGPCPPIGRHRYVHKLYALDAELPDLNAPTKAELERAMKGHILAEAKLVATYEKQ